MRKSGFTLVEIMVVIAIIWILALLSTNFDFNKKTSIEKWWRMINKLSSILKTEFFNSQAWKWVEFWSWIVIPDSREIHIGTWNITINYIWNKTLTWEIFSYPFFWESPYNIKNINYIAKDGSTWSISYPFSIVINNWNISFSWSNSTETGAIRLSITAWFSLDYRTLELDRRTWIVEIKQN